MKTTHFSTLEAAHLAVARLRNDGYAAFVCDDAVASIWGPLAVGGVRVVASEEPVAEADRIADFPTSQQRVVISGLVRFAVMALLSVVAACVLVGLFALAADDPLRIALYLISNTIPIVGVLLLAALLAPWIHGILAKSLLRSETRTSAVDYLVTALGLILIVLVALLL